MSEPFRDGETCLLIDTKGRRYLVDLTAGRQFQYHAGTLQHDTVIGAADGTELRSSTGSRLLALRPRLADFILTMKRGAQVVYPKDIGPMIHWGDIGPGQVVLEAGTGSGALTLGLLRAVGPTGRVVTVERRPDHAALARRTLVRFLGEIPDNLEMVDGEVIDVLGEVVPDRMVLDLPEPEPVVAAAAGNMAPGGVVTVYVPTVPQVQRLTSAMRATKRFGDVGTFEVLLREWKTEGRSVRPESFMVGHTGFITVARHVIPAPPIGGDSSADDEG